MEVKREGETKTIIKCKDWWKRQRGYLRNREKRIGLGKREEEIVWGIKIAQTKEGKISRGEKTVRDMEHKYREKE